MKTCTVALIGAGRIGKMHGEHLSSHISGLKLKAVFDPMVDEPWAKSLGIELITKDLQACADNPQIDAVLIATPSNTHVEIVEKFIRAKKHILCEKPVGFDHKEILRLTKLAKEAGLVFQVGFNRRYDINFRRIQESVRRGDVGQPQIVRITSRDPQAPKLSYAEHSGGLFMDFAIHDFDMARFASGAEVSEVYACGAVLIDQGLAQFNDVDTAITTLRMNNGALCVIDNSRQALYGYDQRVEVFGSLGSIEAENCTPTNTILRNETGMHTDKPHRFFIERYKEAYIEELKDFYTCVMTGETPRSGGHDAAQAVLIAKAAALSLKQNRPIKMSELN